MAPIAAAYDTAPALQARKPLRFIRGICADMSHLSAAAPLRKQAGFDMTGCRQGTAHDASPNEAIDAILKHRGPVLLDLDETLYLRNSTEDFIDSATPRLLALLLLRVLDVLRPWRWTGGEITRDVWRVQAVRCCFPWVGWRWRRRVGTLAGRHANKPLIESLAQCSAPPIIATIGFRPIVEPLIAALGLQHLPIVAARYSSFGDRRRGKLMLTIDALGEETVRRALVVTDSIHDLPLLEACDRPVRTVWPEARFRRAFSGVYLPGQYLSLIKRPGERYVLRGILQEDFAFWLLSSIALASHPVFHVAGLLFLLLSFWAVYERGYVDNDLAASRFENDPKLSDAFLSTKVATPRWAPWLWALAAGAIAIVLLRRPGTPQLQDWFEWPCALLATYGLFSLYNRLDKSTRVWLYFGLQFARTAAFAIVVPIAPVGAAALGAHVISRWVPYHVYRSTRRPWPVSTTAISRLLMFIVLAILLGAALGPAALLNWTALALLGWNLFRARQEFLAVLRSASRIDRAEPPNSL
jgi:hypothetical protein